MRRPESEPLTAAIEIDELTRSFSTGVALDHLTLTVEPGEVLALLGPNGAGKTTTVRLLNGILQPDSGRARVLGLDPTVDGNELRRFTGVLTENAGLDDRLTARENLEFTARIRGWSRREARQRVGDVLDQFGMNDKADQQTQGFSTGERKRVALARSLVHDPDVLFLDEPTSGLDPAATRDVAAMITSLASELGRTIVLATHFLGEAGRLADRMAVLYHGQLQAFGRPDDLAAELWRGIDTDLDLGGTPDEQTLAILRAARGVLGVVPTHEGARVHVEDREVVPRLVAGLVGHEIPVYGATPRTPTLEDVYFEIESRLGDQSIDLQRGATAEDGT
jgi:ABC-2 type transport system ATP-binding protein